MPTGEEVEFDRYRVNRAKRQLLQGEKLVALNGKAFDLLLIFVSSGGTVLSREALYDQLWPDSVVEDGNLSQTIYLLRRALDPAGDGRSYITTVSRFGYRFAKDVRDVNSSSDELRRTLTWSSVAFVIVALTVLTLWSMRSNVVPIPASARDAYALGEYHLSLRTQRDLSYALDYFQEVRREAPRSPIGYTGAASAYALLAEFRQAGSHEQDQFVSLAAQYRDAALSRDPNSADGLAVSGFIAYRYDNDHVTAERDFERALAEDPNDAAAHHWHGVLLLIEGKLPAAIKELENAHRLQPTSEVFSRWLARAYTYAHRPNEAIAIAMQTVRIEQDDSPAWLVIACAEEQRGNLREALQTLRTLGRLDPTEQRYLIPDEARLEVLLQHGTRRSISLQIDRLTAIGSLDSFETALFYLAVGRKARAMDILRAAKRSPFLAAIERYDPRLNRGGRHFWTGSGQPVT